jgi:hypothetical protein
MFNQLTEKRQSNINERTVRLTEYEIFCKEYMFEQLRDIAFGKAFCKKFDIQDRVLNILMSRNSAEQHIKSMQYIQN